MAEAVEAAEAADTTEAAEAAETKEALAEQAEGIKYSFWRIEASRVGMGGGGERAGIRLREIAPRFLRVRIQ